MSKDSKKLFVFVVLVWIAALLASSFAILFGYDWFTNGNLRICLPSDALAYPDGNLNSPSHADSQKGILWCHEAYGRAEQRRATALETERRRIETIENKCKSRGVGVCAQGDVECTLMSAVNLAACVKANDFDGMRNGSGDDIFSGFSESLFQLIGRYLDETAVQYFFNRIAPVWNDFFSGDDPLGSTPRFAIASIITVIFSAIWVNTVRITYDWLKQLLE